MSALCTLVYRLISARMHTPGCSTWRFDAEPQALHLKSCSGVSDDDSSDSIRLNAASLLRHRSVDITTVRGFRERGAIVLGWAVSGA
eukprot:CAMPEP_0185544200 /NCGR_PEP_ID=MMETSP1381-20130426/3863_1 /TAXON_ID=298111 /ORGANISM="Pavlova sp., Strain CCMP459" /LENGTH=86 /DNA_ID=CAMNT_0028156381 /DNA_START=54 /DNA_END=314 /DNA_ORIENTATION=+